MSARSVTRTLAEFATDPAFDDLPEAVTHAVRRAAVDWAGVTLAGVRHPASGLVIEAAVQLGARGECQVAGSEHRLDPVNATLANAVTAHVLDWDDTILPSRAHPSATLFPALIATGELRDWTLEQIIPAFAIGFEIQARLNLAAYPSIHRRGWQGTGIVGGPGVAAAIGRMLKLDAGKMVHALGIAAATVSGPIATFGSMSKPLNIGRAAASGLQSAQLAALGFTSHEDMLGEGGFLALFDDAPRLDILVDGLGERWSILEDGFKPYPCGFVAHAMIDSVRDLRSQSPSDAELVGLKIRVSPESTYLMGNADPRNELEAKFSLLYEAAVAWTDGHVTPLAFEDAAVRDPRYREVMAVTEITASEEVSQHEAFAVAAFADGRTQSVHVPHARGSALRPMSDDDLLDKFAAAASLGRSAKAKDLGAALLHGEDMTVSRLMEMLV